ncbi:MAG: sensor domain-containing protein, partial [Actinomycetota bacterium]|nr:sensor domain-containing protein [Actinomycetota bacterium]
MPATARVHRGPFAATGYALAYLALSIPALALFCITATGIPLVLVTAGIILLLISVPSTAVLAGIHRQMAAWFLGEPVPAFYRPTSGLGVIARLRAWGSDPARWRDFAWLLVTSTIGFTLSMLVVTLMLSVVWYAVFPFIFWVTPKGVFNMDLGFWTIDTQSESFYVWVAAVVFALLWWWLAAPLVRAKAMIDRAL